uniref:Uncharacterized protein n=2 Tax=Physcomitrium patens TaxID=3218 RepID=A0A7I3ZJN5_PHYPA
MSSIFYEFMSVTFVDQIILYFSKGRRTVALSTCLAFQHKDADHLHESNLDAKCKNVLAKFPIKTPPHKTKQFAKDIVDGVTFETITNQVPRLSKKDRNCSLFYAKFVMITFERLTSHFLQYQLFKIHILEHSHECNEVSFIFLNL